MSRLYRRDVAYDTIFPCAMEEGGSVMGHKVPCRAVFGAVSPFT